MLFYKIGSVCFRDQPDNIGTLALQVKLNSMVVLRLPGIDNMYLFGLGSQLHVKHIGCRALWYTVKDDLRGHKKEYTFSGVFI